MNRECHLQLKKGERHADFCALMLELQIKVIDLENSLRKDKEIHEKFVAIFEKQYDVEKLAKGCLRNEGGVNFGTAAQKGGGGNCKIPNSYQ